MHVPLDEHLHTEECNIIIRELKRCHEETSLFRQFFGECNKLDWAMRDCTRQERLTKTADQLHNSKKRNADIQKKMGELKSADWRENLKEKMDAKNGKTPDMVGDSDPDTKKGMSRAQEACRVTVQKDPCWRESKLSLKCLDDNSYNKSLCQAEFENYKQCKTFWNQVSWARRKEGRFPLVPESEEERAAFKMKYRETRKIPTEV